MSSVNVAELRSGLVKAKHLIREPHMWSGGGHRSLGVGFCVFEACIEMDSPGALFTSPLGDNVWKALRDTNGMTRNQMYDWNDDAKTTHADIMALFDRAISALDIQEFLSIANEAEKPLVTLTDALNRAWLAYGVGE